MKTFSTIGFWPSDMEVIEVDEVIQPNGPDIVDRSAFVPTSEALKALKSGAVSPAIVQGFYDFPNGRDNGMKVPVDRSARYTGDIAEMSVAVRESQVDVQEGLSKARKQFDQEQFIEKLKADVSSTSAPTSNS